MLESWIILFLSIFCEVTGTSCLKLSDGFSKIRLFRVFRG